MASEESADFISHPNTGTLHRGTRDGGAECGQPSDSWATVDADNPLDAVLTYGTEPCTKCIRRTLGLHSVLLKVHSSYVVERDLSELIETLPGTPGGRVGW